MPDSPNGISLTFFGAPSQAPVRPHAALQPVVLRGGIVQQPEQGQELQERVRSSQSNLRGLVVSSASSAFSTVSR